MQYMVYSYVHALCAIHTNVCTFCHSLQAYGFIRILYGIGQENTEYGESDIILVM
jgi:hypothetical protein